MFDLEKTKYLRAENLHVVFYVAVAALSTYGVIRYLYSAFTHPDPQGGNNEKQWMSAYDKEARRTQWRNGGFVVFYSSKGNALLINAASGDPCTHIGLVFRLENRCSSSSEDSSEEDSNEEDNEAPWLMIHADRPETREDLMVDSDEEGGEEKKKHGGVQVVALDYYLETNGNPPAFYGHPPEGVEVPGQEALTQFIVDVSRQSRREGYEPNLLRLLAVATARDPKAALVPYPRPEEPGKIPKRPWFCSAFVAWIYKEWGWLPPASIDAFHPKHFQQYL